MQLGVPHVERVGGNLSTAPELPGPRVPVKGDVKGDTAGFEPAGMEPKKEDVPLPPEVIRALKDAANSIALAFKIDLQFEVDTETQIETIKVVCPRTGAVIREIPPKEVLVMIKKLWEGMGLFVDNRV